MIEFVGEHQSQVFTTAGINHPAGAGTGHRVSLLELLERHPGPGTALALYPGLKRMFCIYAHGNGGRPDNEGKDQQHYIQGGARQCPDSPNPIQR